MTEIILGALVFLGGAAMAAVINAAFNRRLASATTQNLNAETAQTWQQMESDCRRRLTDVERRLTVAEAKAATVESRALAAEQRASSAEQRAAAAEVRALAAEQRAMANETGRQSDRGDLDKLTEKVTHIEQQKAEGGTQ